MSGFYNSKDGARLGAKKGLAASRKYASQTGKIKIDTEVISLLEALGIEGFKERVEQSKYSKPGRIFSESGFLVMKIINSPISLQTMYSNLYDTRIVEIDGVNKVVQYQNYDSIMKSVNPDLTTSEINSMWKANKNYILNYVDIDKGKITPKQEFID